MIEAERLLAEYGPVPEEAVEAAAWWHELLDEACGDPGIEARFEAWLEADADHAAAWRRVALAWDGAAQAAAQPRVLVHRRRALASRSRAPRAAALAAGLCLAAALAASAAVSWRMLAPVTGSEAVQTAQTAPGEYVTAVGQRSTVVLDDGSRVELNTASRVMVSMEGVERQVRLTHGQALFEVAPDPARPFVVEAGDRRITALGTVFDVRVGETEPSVQVTMVEGLTRVERSPAAESRAAEAEEDEPAVELGAGEQLIARPAAAAERRAVDAARVTSWRQGRLVFENDSLGDALAEMNRYARRTIVLDDPELAGLRVSGVFTAGRSEVFIEALEGVHGLGVARAEADRIVLARAD